jgi:hypothetical protein
MISTTNSPRPAIPALVIASVMLALIPVPTVIIFVRLLALVFFGLALSSSSVGSGQIFLDRFRHAPFAGIVGHIPAFAELKAVAEIIFSMRPPFLHFVGGLSENFDRPQSGYCTCSGTHKLAS